MFDGVAGGIEFFYDRIAGAVLEDGPRCLCRVKRVGVGGLWLFVSPEVARVGAHVSGFEPWQPHGDSLTLSQA